MQEEQLPLAFPFRTISRPENSTSRRTWDQFPGVTDPSRRFLRLPRAQKRKVQPHRQRDDGPLDRFPLHPASCEIRGGLPREKRPVVHEVIAQRQALRHHLDSFHGAKRLDHARGPLPIVRHHAHGFIVVAPLAFSSPKRMAFPKALVYRH